MTTTPITEAKAKGRAGAKRATEHAEREAPGWTDQAVQALRAQAKHWRGRSAGFTVDALRGAIADTVPAPTDGRAWGTATKQAIAAGYIEPTGESAPAASSHGAPKPLYRTGPQA